mgnify:CR=1 FL=1
MKNIMRSIILGFFVFVSTVLVAQQEQQYTQFMYNKLGLNPGYAGSTDAGCLTAIYRKQWIGLDGSPSTQMLSYNTPMLNKRVGVGLSLLRNSIGIENRITLEGTYAYRIQVGRGTLGIGIMASVRRRAVGRVWRVQRQHLAAGRGAVDRLHGRRRRVHGPARLGQRQKGR